MKEVLIKHTSETTFKTLELAQAQLNWINENLRAAKKPADPRPSEFMQVDKSWKSVVFVRPQQPIDVNEVDDLVTLRKRYPVFDNQTFIVHDDDVSYPVVY